SGWIPFCIRTQGSSFLATLVCLSIFLVWYLPNWKMELPLRRPAQWQRHGCDRSTLGPRVRSPAGSARALRPELEPLPERPLASSYYKNESEHNRIMNQNLTPVYAGLDIAKASLQLHLQSRLYDLSNTGAGHTQLLKRLATIAGVHVICEATGGYERAVVAALQAASIPVSVINHTRVRQFARASGQLAKTDPIDAA